MHKFLLLRPRHFACICKYYLFKNGFPIGKVGRKFKIHLPKKYCEKGNEPVDAVIVDIPFTESYNPNTREAK